MTPNPNNECQTDHEATLTFNTRSSDSPTPIARQDVSSALIPSFSVDSEQYNYCFRAVEGRPFIDVHGRQVQAREESHTTYEKNRGAGWSTTTHNRIDPGEYSTDKELGKQWVQRALGEHASVPAFAAFVIALMSNGAPPNLIEDALSAARDEVNHAKTSFEIASLLLGETVGPTALSPSNHTFGRNLSALAVAAAKEGCIDETLSALAAGLEVDYEIERYESINDVTKDLLKDRIRTIAIEETQHSVLAWRSVHWACQLDNTICTDILTHQVFTNIRLEQAFSKRFRHYPKDVSDQVWEHFDYIVTNNMKVLLSDDAVEDGFDREIETTSESVLRTLEEENGSFVKYLSHRIVHDLAYYA
jgi:hypothetical protein